MSWRRPGMLSNPSHHSTLPSGDVTRDNPYEDVKLSPMCIPIARPLPKVMDNIPCMSRFNSTGVFLLVMHQCNKCVNLRNKGRRDYCSLIPSNYLKLSINLALLLFQLPSKPQTLYRYASKVDRKVFQAVSKSSTIADTPKPAAPRRGSTQKIHRIPQVYLHIQLNLILWLADSIFGAHFHVTCDWQSGSEWWFMFYVEQKRRRLLVEQEEADAENNR